jgi:hypothetical protein
MSQTPLGRFKGNLGPLMYHIISGLKTYVVQGNPAFRMNWFFPTIISEVLRGIESIIAANIRSIHFIVASCSSGNRLAEGGLCKFGFRESDKLAVGGYCTTWR